MFLRRQPAAILGILLAIAVSGLLASAAPAMDKAYLGTWSQDGSDCNTGKSIHIATTGFGGRDFACAPHRVTREKGGWRGRYACNDGRKRYKLDVRWRLLKDGRLRETIAGKVRDYARCAQVAADSPPKSFAEQCLACFIDARTQGRSVGGYCPSDCADTPIECDASGRCRLPD